MGIFSRTRDIIAANVTDLLDKAEDPAKMIRMIILEMEETLVEVRASAARTIADQNDRKVLGVDFFDFSDYQFAAFFPCLLTDVIIVDIEDVESFSFTVLESSPCSDPVECGIPAFAGAVRSGRKPECPGIFQFVQVGIVMNWRKLAFVFSIIPADSDRFIIQAFVHFLDLMSKGFLGPEKSDLMELNEMYGMRGTVFPKVSDVTGIIPANIEGGKSMSLGNQTG